MQALQKCDEELASESSEMMEQRSQTGPWRKSVVVFIGSALLVAVMVMVNNAPSGGLNGVREDRLISFEETACHDPGSNCIESKCCSNKSHKCYLKNQYWAHCAETCDTDYQDEYDKRHNITVGWACKELDQSTLPCPKDDEDCSDNTNCCPAGDGSPMICFRKAPGWSNCNPTCTRTGVNDYDKDGGAWSCEHHELVCKDGPLLENATACEQLECCQETYCGGKNSNCHGDDKPGDVCTYYEELAKNASCPNI